MGLKGKLTMETDTKVSAEMYYNTFKTQYQNFIAISPDKLGAVQLHQGNWDSHGSVKVWTYTIDGKIETMKEKTEHDDANKSVRFTALDGDVLKVYKSYITTIEAIASDSGTVSRLTLEYEKRKESDPVPIGYFGYLTTLFMNDFEAYLVKALTNVD